MTQVPNGKSRAIVVTVGNTRSQAMNKTKERHACSDHNGEENTKKILNPYSTPNSLSSHLGKYSKTKETYPHGWKKCLFSGKQVKFPTLFYKLSFMQKPNFPSTAIKNSSLNTKITQQRASQIPEFVHPCGYILQPCLNAEG